MTINIDSATAQSEAITVGRPAQVAQPISRWMKMSRLIGRQTTRILGNDVTIDGVTGKGILHMPTDIVDDQDSGILYSRASGSYMLEIVAQDFTPPIRGDEVLVDGISYRVISDSTPLYSTLERFSDGEILSVPLARLS